MSSWLCTRSPWSRCSQWPLWSSRGSLRWAATELSSVFDGYQQARVGLDRIGDLLRTPTSVPAAENPVAVPARLRGEVTFKEVDFAYTGVEALALSDLSLEVAAGETVALVGATGA